MMKYCTSAIGLAAALALAGTAHAADADDVAVATQVEIVDPVTDPVDVKLDDPVEITRAGDDGIIAENERNLGDRDPLENPDVIFYTMGAGFDPVEQAAETAAEQAAQQVADRMAEKAAASEAPVPAEPR